MSDFSWPVFYRLTIKNEDQLPRYVIPGRRLKIKLNMVNELDMFRGDDILAECPIPLRVSAIPVQDGNSIDANGKLLNHHEIFTEVLSKSVSCKPVIERGGQGAVIIDLSPSPVLRLDEELLFVLQIGISSSSRLFNHVIPVTTQPLIMVSPHSAYAKQHLKRTQEDEHEDGSEDEYEDEDEEDEHDHGHDHDHSKCGGHHGHKHHHKHHDEDGKTPLKAGGHGHDQTAALLKAIHSEKPVEGATDADDQEIPEDVFDGEGEFDMGEMEGEMLYDEDGEALFGSDDWLSDEDYEDEDYEDEDQEDQVDPLENDRDIYEEMVENAEEQEELETNLAELPGIFHAFICDPLLHTPLHPKLDDKAVEKKDTQQVAATPIQSGIVPPPFTTTTPTPPPQHDKPQILAQNTQFSRNGPQLQVSGAVTRRPKALPPALQKQQQQQQEQEKAKLQQQQAAVQQQQQQYQYPVVGNKTEGMAQQIFEKPVHHLLDPLNGLFATTTHQTSSTIQTRHTIALASYAYIKVVQGISIGGRIWDGAIYLMKFLKRLLEQTHTVLDGSRCLELGSGTGVLGIWWWQLVQQRTISQLNQLCAKHNVLRAEVEAVLALICNGDFTQCAKVFLKAEGKQQQVFSITIKKDVYDVALMLKNFQKQKPTMIVTDQPKIMPLLDQNVKLNTTNKNPLYNQRVAENGLKYQHNDKTNTITISVANPLQPITQLPLHQASITGLHALTCDWNAPLHKHLYKSCGLYLPLETDNLFNPTKRDEILAANAPYQAFLQQYQLPVELPAGLGKADITFTPGFEDLCKLNAVGYDELSTNVLAQYQKYDSLIENKVEGAKTTGLEGLLSAQNTPGVMLPGKAQQQQQQYVQYQNLQGLDLIMAVECLYNDRYFEALQRTIVGLYQAHMYAFAQKIFLYSQLTTKAQQDQAPPTMQLPMILLSYRYRAVHEEKLIQDTFFAPLEKVGLYHTEMSLFRLLGESTIHQQTSGTVNSTSDVVLQRVKERKERENAIRNAIADLDLDRQHNTRFAIIYYCPGVVTSTKKALSPLQYLSANAQFWYKLFQKL